MNDDDEMHGLLPTPAISNPGGESDKGYSTDRSYYDDRPVDHKWKVLQLKIGYHP